MIVLAIAGLILLIVFLAIPALQRSQRNTGRKEDAGRLVTAFQDFISNSAGNLPSDTSSSTNADCNSIISDAGTMNQYKNLSCGTAIGAPDSAVIEGQAATTSSSASSTSSSIPLSASPTGNAIVFVLGASCSGTSTYKTSTIQSQAALFYSLESGGGNYQWACENA